MTVSKPTACGKKFSFTPEDLEEVKKIQQKYPLDYPQACLIEVLLLAQQNNGWISMEVVDYLSQLLNIPIIKIWEIVTFHDMFQTRPLGRFVVQLCTTTPCWLMGSTDLLRTCQKWLGIKMDQTTIDGLFTLQETCCLGACSNGPAVRINDRYYEDLDEDSMVQILESIAENKKLNTRGSRKGRRSSEPTSEIPNASK